MGLRVRRVDAYRSWPARVQGRDNFKDVLLRRVHRLRVITRSNSSIFPANVISPVGHFQGKLAVYVTPFPPLFV